MTNDAVALHLSKAQASITCTPLNWLPVQHLNEHIMTVRASAHLELMYDELCVLGQSVTLLTSSSSSCMNRSQAGKNRPGR